MAWGQTLDRPLIADNQQFLALAGTTDNKGLCRNTYQNWFKVKVAATGLLFPLSQTYSSWNDSEKQTLPVALANLSREHVQDFELMMAGSVVTLAPVLLLFVFLQRYYISGLLAGSVKG